MHRFSRALLTLLLTLLLAPLAYGRESVQPLPLDAARRKALDEAIVHILDAKKTPSFSVAVVENDRIVYTRAVGMADVEHGTPATPATRYRVASISKMFTAVAVMQQVAEHHVALDAPVATYVPWAPHGKEITVAQLLLHRSGLPDFGDRALADGTAKKPATPKEIVAYAGADLDFPPGTAYEYSNTNYVLLGQIVEAVSKKPLGDYLQNHVFTPAGMTSTTFEAPPAGAPFATGYDLSSGKPLPAEVFDPSWFYGCGSIVSTADDLARFDIALTTGKLVSHPLLSEMVKAAQPTLAANRIEYGYGLQVYHLGRMTLFGHHGGLPGYETDDSMVEGGHFALVVLSNSFQFPTSSFMGQAFGILYPEALAEAKAHPRPAPADAYPALTATTTKFLQTLSTGAVDDALCAPALSNALTLPQRASIGVQFKVLGLPKKVTWLGVTRIGKLMRQEYVVEYASKTVRLDFVYDASGRITGFFFA